MSLGIGITGGGGGSATNSPSLSVGLSSSTVEFGASLTVTATPSDITPTNYYAFIDASDVLEQLGDQASNIITANVNSAVGTNKVFVMANDGTDSCANINGETLTITAIYMDNAFGGALGLWSTVKRNESFSSPILRTRRSSDSDEADFTPVTESPERLNSASTASNSSPASHDGSTFATFISSDNGFMPNLYDQAGSVDTTQTTAGAQAKIATSGTINTIGSYPAMTFDGNDNFIGWNNTTAPAAYQSLSDSITIIAWIEPSIVTGSGSTWSPSRTIVELRVNASNSTSKIPFSFGFENSKLMCGFSDNYLTGAEKITANKTMVAGTLYQVAVIIDGDSVSLFIDGNLDTRQVLTTATGDRSVTTSNSSLIIGSRTRDGGQADFNYYSGELIDLAIYDSVLTDANIKTIYDYYQS